jgi:hypothetical protein
MTDFLNALKADLLDRRLLPIVALVAVALVGTLAYAALGGGSSSAPTPTAPVAPVTAAASGIATSEESTTRAAAEVTSGASAQRHGQVHNPFQALANPVAEAAAAKAAATAKGATGTSGSTTSGVSGGSAAGPSEAATPAKPSKPSKPSKRHTLYHVAVLFGALPAAGVTAVPLTPFENLKLLTPLPSSQLPLIVFRGVTTGGKSATFTVVGEAILHGSATCLPSSSQCQAIDLKPGQAEQLEYLPAGGPVVIYELKIVSIGSTKASTAGVRSFLHGASKAGRVVLARKGLDAIPFLRYTSQAGVLAFAEHRTDLRAHISGRKHHRP